MVISNILCRLGTPRGLGHLWRCCCAVLPRSSSLGCTLDAHFSIVGGRSARLSSCVDSHSCPSGCRRPQCVARPVQRLLAYCSAWAIAVCLVACDIGSVEYELPYDGDRLVLNGVLSNTGARASLTRSHNPNLSQLVPLSVEGQVWLCDTEGSELSSLQANGAGNYSLTVALLEGVGYRLKATVPDLGEVISGVVVIPRAVIPDGFVKVGEGVSPINGDDVYFLDIEFVDPLQTRDFYICRAFEKRGGVAAGRLYIGQNTGFDQAELCEYGIIFPDNCFSGLRHTYFGMIEAYAPDVWPPDSIYVEFGTASAEHYQYSRSLSQQPEGALLLFGDPFPFFSNVSGGYGAVIAEHTYLYQFGLID